MIRSSLVLSVFILVIGCTNEIGEPLDEPLDTGPGDEPLDEPLDTGPGDEPLDEPLDELADVGPGDIGPGDLEPLDEPLEVTLDIDAKDLGGYRDGGPWVTISYEDAEHKTAILSASRIALLAKTLIDVWEEKEYPNLDAVTDRLSRFHIFAIANDDTFARFKYPDLYAENPTAALEKLGTSGAFCYPHGDARYTDVPESARFFIVIKGEFLTEYWGRETVLHELMHPALAAGFGDSDPDHAMADMWMPRSGIDNGSFMSAVIDRYP